MSIHTVPGGFLVRSKAGKPLSQVLATLAQAQDRERQIERHTKKRRPGLAQTERFETETFPDERFER